ncbi:50S ribosomal protein L29 [Candidatus Woesearchaeota archaeon]|nr:50S ribosomal protein L29 [Candidatus Woesearchaeota archaeon]|tara:strand:+ start:6579 stop:6800 length:222 start_codon:yes stop_codon:yes gene_type:complete
MAMLKNKELRSINPGELKTKLDELRKDLIKLNVQKSTGTSAKNPMQIKEIRKTIARILTLLHKKEKNGGGLKK